MLPLFSHAFVPTLTQGVSLGLLLDLCSLGIEGLCLPLGQFIPGPLPWLGFYLTELLGTLWRYAGPTWRLWRRVMVVLGVVWPSKVGKDLCAAPLFFPPRISGPRAAGT